MPAVAAIQNRRVLSGVNGRKGYVGGHSIRLGKSRDTTLDKRFYNACALSIKEVGRISRVEVEFINTGRTTVWRRPLSIFY